MGVCATVSISLLTLLLAVGVAHTPAAQGSDPSASLTSLDARITDAFRAAYNLDRVEALALAREVAHSAPNVSRARRTLASIIWLDLLYRRGAVTVDHFMGGVAKSQLSLPKPPADLASEFRRELSAAETLASSALVARPTDVNAQYDLAAAYGLDASYGASIDGSLMTAFKAGKRAYDAAEIVMSRDPHRVEAGTIVGTYRYSVSTLGIASRMFAYLAGFGGGKEKGIALLEAARASTLSRFDATSALILIYSREGRHLDAVHLIREMQREFPKNRLFLLEEGSALLRAGQAAQGEAVLDRGLVMFEQDEREKIPGERALWLYKRGMARLQQNHRANAADDLARALEAKPAEWVRARVTLAQGQLADLAGRRGEAMASYRLAREISLGANDPVCAADASRFMKAPFVMSGG